MRISESMVVQLVESDPPQVVFVQDSTGQEFVLSAEEAANAWQALAYFGQYLGFGPGSAGERRQPEG